MGIVGNLFIELKKHKRRCNLLLFIAVIVAEMAFLYGNFHGKEATSAGWMLLFYNIPIINCVFFPVAIAGFASRLMDIEHKGEMLKCLYTFSTPQKIFFTKYLYGAICTLILVAMQCGSIILCCGILGFDSNFPLKYLLIHGVITYITCMTLLSIHLLLSFFYRNQALSISVGILGSFTAFFSLVLPESIIQKFLPWATFVTSGFVTMDWNRDTREVKYALGTPDYTSTIICIGWIVLLTCITLMMLKKSGVEEAEKIKSKRKTTKIVLHKRPVEILKLKGSPAWIAFFIVPAISAAIGTVNYLANLSILKEGWYSLWTQHTLFLCYFFMPVIIGIFTGCIWRVEHSGTNMNILMTHQRPAMIVLGKYAATCFITSVSLIWVVALYLIAGSMIHIDGELPSGIIQWMGLGILSSWVICAFQVLVSLVIRNFVLPIIVAFLGGFAGLSCIAKDMPYLTPFSLFDLAMNQRELGNANIGAFTLSSVIFIVVFIMISIVYLSRSDVRSNE